MSGLSESPTGSWQGDSLSSNEEDGADTFWAAEGKDGEGAASSAAAATGTASVAGGVADPSPREPSPRDDPSPRDPSPRDAAGGAYDGGGGRCRTARQRAATIGSF